MLLENLKYISVFLIGLAVTTSVGKILAIATTLAVIACIIDKERFANVRNAIFNKTILLFLLYVGTLMLVAVMQNNWDGLRLILRSFEKIVSFLIIYLLIGNEKNSMIYGILGAVIGFFVGEASVVYDVFYGSHQFGNRFGGIHGHPNALGSVLELAVPLLLYAFFLFRNNKKIMYPILIIFLGIFPCLLFSGSRGAMMAVGVELVIGAAIICYRKYSLKTKNLYFLGIFTAIVVGLFSFASLYGRSYDTERILLWISAWNMFLDYPILGVGFGNWNEIYQAAFVSPLAKEPGLAHPHNLYLYLLSEIGVVGFFSYFSMIIWQVKIASEQSEKYYASNKDYLNVYDMFILAFCGMIIHNLVDVSAVLRYYMLIYFFYWGLCCMEYKQCRNV